MRTTRQTRQPAPEPLTEAEVAQHIRVAFDALNSILIEAARHDQNFAVHGRVRYSLTLTSTDNLCCGRGIIEDHRSNQTFDIRVCFGTSVSDVQLRREFFEDISTSEVRVKASSLPSLFRNFLEFLRSTRAATTATSNVLSFGAQHASPLSAIAS